MTYRFPQQLLTALLLALAAGCGGPATQPAAPPAASEPATAADPMLIRNDPTLAARLTTARVGRAP
ncbi:MAG: hypothetical protein MUC42_16200, partial [Bryobacter sp.]|nr:hypothetical protein [Bryobacter sp.]